MAASIYRSTAVSAATYGTPDVSGLIVTGFSISESADVQEVKDDQLHLQYDEFIVYDQSQVKLKYLVNSL